MKTLHEEYKCFPFRTYKEYTDCKIIAVPAKYDFVQVAFGMQKNSPYLDLFNYYLQEMTERGSLKQIQEKYEPQSQTCPDLNGKPLTFGAVFTGFIILAFGAGLAMILFLLENLPFNLPFLNSYGSEFEGQSSHLIAQLMVKDMTIDVLKRRIEFLKRNDPWT